MGAPEGADTGDKVKKYRPRGAACGAAAGRYRSLVFGGFGGRSPPDFCYFDNIDLSFLGGLGGAAPQIPVILII